MHTKDKRFFFNLAILTHMYDSNPGKAETERFLGLTGQTAYPNWRTSESLRDAISKTKLEELEKWLGG